MDVLGEGYELKGMVCCISHHFTIAVNNHSEWIYIDEHEFKKVVKLTVNQRGQGSDMEQSNFRALLTRARYGDSTMSDWESLIFRTADKVNNINNFRQHSVRLLPQRKSCRIKHE